MTVSNINSIQESRITECLSLLMELEEKLLDLNGEKSEKELVRSIWLSLRMENLYKKGFGYLVDKCIEDAYKAVEQTDGYLSNISNTTDNGLLVHMASNYINDFFNRINASFCV